MALLETTRLYYTLPWLYLTPLHSTMALLGSTWLYYTIPLLVLALLVYYTLPCLYYILPWLHVTLLDSTTLYHGSTWFYCILPWLHLTLHDSTTFYHGSTLTLLDSTTPTYQLIMFFPFCSKELFNSLTNCYYRKQPTYQYLKWGFLLCPIQWPGIVTSPWVSRYRMEQMVMECGITWDVSYPGYGGLQSMSKACHDQSGLQRFNI